MIKEIIMHDIKGQRGIQPLTGKDIIIGPNGAGKTTRLQSLGISLLGYIPGEAKTPAETFKLSTGETMKIGLKTDSFSFERSFTRKVKTKRNGETSVSIEQDINVFPGLGEKGLKGKEARINMELGSFPVMLDFGEYLGLSDAKRREFIYSLSPIKTDKWNKETVQEYLKEKLLLPELEDNNPDKYMIMRKLIDETMEQYHDNFDLHTALQAMSDWASAKLTEWNKKKRDALGAVKKIAEIKNNLKETDRNIAQNKEELEKLQQQLTNVEKQISADTEKIKAINRRSARIDELEKLIQETENNEGVDVDSKRKKLEGSIEKINKSIAELVEAISGIEHEITNLETEIEHLTKEKEMTLKKITGLKSERAELIGKYNTINENVKVIKTHSGTCVIDSRIECNKDFAKYLDHCEKQLKAIQAQIGVLDKEINEETKYLDALSNQIIGFKQQYSQKKTRLNEPKKGKSDHEQQLQAYQRDLNKLDNHEEVKQEKLKLYRKELQKLQDTKVEPIAPIDILEKQKEGLGKQISTLKQKTEEQEKAKITLSNLKTSMIDKDEAVHYADNLKYLNEALGSKGLQGEIVKEILDPLADMVQENLRLMGINNRFYFKTESDRGKEIFQFGWINGEGRHINFNALSTGEQLIMLIAFLVTVIERANPKLKILAIDKVEHLTRLNFIKVIKGLDAVSHKLDNIIFNKAMEYDETIKAKDVPGWTVWNLSQEAGDMHEQAS